MNSTVKVIFFDVGNTLLFPNRERIHAPLTHAASCPMPTFCAIWNVEPRINSTG